MAPGLRREASSKEPTSSSEATAYLDDYLSSIRGNDVAAREDALRREVGTLSALLQNASQVSGSASRDQNQAFTSMQTGTVRESVQRGQRVGETASVPVAQPASLRGSQQRQSELFIAQRFARFFMERLLLRVGGQGASLSNP